MLQRLKHFIRKTDPAYLLIIALALIAAWAFILRPSLPRETDAELHVFRAAELGYSLRAGVLFPRWAADFYYGYGYPIFHYYAPLTYYLANIFSLLIPGGAVFGVKMVFITTFIGGGWGVYHTARNLSSKQGGVIAASSYLFMPYIFLIDSHLRGDLAEFFALAVGPLSFAALTAFHQKPNRKHFLYTTLMIAALILTHNLLALVYFAMLSAYVLWLHLIAPLFSKSQTRGFSPLLMLRLGSPLIIGLCLSAFFWLPVGLEQDAVQLQNLIGPGHFDYRNHFLTISELLSHSIPLDHGAINPEFRLNLGLAQWVLAMIGIVFLILNLIIPTKTDSENTQTDSPPIVIFWIISLLILIALMLPISLSVWDTIPMMVFLQFPWRLLGPAALCLAIIGGYGGEAIHSRLPQKLHRYAFPALLLLPPVLALSIFTPPAWDNFGATDQLAMLDFELNGLALGTTSTGDFVPVDVDLVPGPNQDLLDSYQAGGLIDKVNRRTLPEGTSVEVIRHRPTSDLFAVQSDEDFTLRLYTFMFAGWKASIDGEPIDIEVAKPEGFITIPVPAGEHQVRVWLGPTPARTLGNILSLLGVGATAFAMWQLSPSSDEPTRIDQPIVWRNAGIGLAIFVLIAGAGNFLNLFQPQSEGIIALPAEYDQQVYMEGGIDLIGYDVPSDIFSPGDTIPITLYWKAREPVAGNYQVFVHLTSIPQHTWGQSDKLNPGDYPSTRWGLDRYVRDPHNVTIPYGTPPGVYTIRVGLWNHATGIRQLVLEEDGTILGDTIALPIQIEVGEANQQPSPEMLPSDILPIQQSPIEGLTLLGLQVDPNTPFDAEIGLLKLNLYWQATQNNLPDIQIALRIVDSEGQIILEQLNPPTDGLYPSTQWMDGQLIRDVHSFWIDQSLPEGIYTILLAVQIDEKSSANTWITLFEWTRILP